MKNGKMPLSTKKDFVSPSEAFGGGELDLMPEVAEYIAKKGWGWKWISTRHLRNNGGRHKAGWQVFQAPAELKIPTNLFGQSPQGTISVGDLVLGVKPLKGPGVSIENHKKVLAQRVAAKTSQSLGSGVARIKVEDDIPSE